MDMVTYDNDLDFLTQLSYRLNDITSYDPIKDIALPMIQQYTLSPYAHFTIYDAMEKTLKISHIQAESAILNTIIAYTGKKLFTTLTPVDQEGYELISSSGISFLSSLTDLSFGAIPPILDQAIKKLTGFSIFCAIPQIDQGMLFGTTILAFKKHQQLPSSTFLKSYSSILSLALRKKQSEEKLQEKELMLRHLTDSMGEVFWMRNKDNSQLHYINHAYEKIWGRSCQSLQDHPDSFLDALHPEDKGKVMEAYGNFQNPYGIKLEYRIIRPDNDLRWINVRTYPVKDQHHRIYAYAGFAIDITEQKRMETLKQQLIEKLSHEFRTPLSSLKQAFGIMKMQVLAVEPDLCQVLDRNILRLESLLDKIIDFNALNKENLSLLRTNTRLSDLVMEVKGKSLQLNPTLSITIDERDPEMFLFLDQVMIKKVLEEIIQNAVIHGQADHVLIETSSSPNYDKILISDNGRGIPEEDVSKVFDPFYQSKEEYQTKRGRAGLGLPVAKRIIESHGGSISVQSPQNKGTIVSITFFKAICI